MEARSEAGATEGRPGLWAGCWPAAPTTEATNAPGSRSVPTGGAASVRSFSDLCTLQGGHSGAQVCQVTVGLGSPPVTG